MKLSDYLMARLAEAGVREVFFLPGGGAMHLNDALAREARLAPIACHHEQACAIAAEACGRMRGGFGVALVTTGPGATNAITPVAGAWIESVPLLVLSGQVKRADRLNGRPLRQGGVQEVDIVSLVRPVTKYAATIEDPASIRHHFERALNAMLEGRPGPVWLDIPLDVQAAQIDAATLSPFKADAAGPTQLGPAIKQTMELLAAAKRPLLLAGHGIRIAGAAAQFLALAERLGVPVVTTWNALDIIPWEHPLCVGRPGTVALRAPNFAVQNCDFLLAIGSRIDNVITAYNPRGFARAARKAVVDVDGNELDRLEAEMNVDVRIQADAGAFINALGALELPPGNCIAAWRTRCQDWKQRYATADGNTFPSAGPISHYHFVSALSDALPPDTPVSTGSSGLAIEAFYTMFRNKSGQRIFLTSGLGAMGYGLPAAIGTCLGNGKRPMVAVESDGSLQLNLQELATLKAQRLPICLLLMNNAGYCSIRNTQRNYFEGRFIGTGPEGGLWLPDMEKVAAAYEFPFLRITDAATLAAGLKAALSLPRPCLVDVRLVENETLAPKSAAIPQADGSMVSMPLEDMSPLLPIEELQAQMEVTLQAASFRARGLPVPAQSAHGT